MLEENSHLACIQSSPIVRPNESSTDAKTWSYGSVLWCKQQSRSNSQAKKKCRVCLPANPYVPELSLFKHSDVKMSRATAYYRLCPALNLLFIILLFKSSLFISSSLFPIFIFLIMSPFSCSPPSPSLAGVSLNEGDLLLRFSFPTEAPLLQTPRQKHKGSLGFYNSQRTY